MKKLGEEVAYLRGLAEGLDIDDKSKEGKMIGKIVEILGCFADKVEELELLGREYFINLSLEEQCIALSDILNLITNINTTVSLNSVNLKASRKVVSFNISKLKEFKIINESITGLYSNEVTIV